MAKQDQTLVCCEEAPSEPMTLHESMKQLKNNSLFLLEVIGVHDSEGADPSGNFSGTCRIHEEIENLCSMTHEINELIVSATRALGYVSNRIGFDHKTKGN